MTPDDPRHGTVSGYKYLGCRCRLCRAATVRYEKGRRWLVHQGLTPTVPARGFKRRVHALMTIGWTQKEIAAELGIAQGNLAQKLRLNDTVRRATHERMAEVYERRCMTVRYSMVARRTAAIAARRGWPGPLAWDDIDNDPAPMTGCTHTGCLNKVVTRGMCDTHNRDIPAHQRTAWHDDIDPVVVARILAGEYTLKATRAEKEAVVAAWPGSQYRLAELTGWKVERYTRQDGAA